MARDEPSTDRAIWAETARDIEADLRGAGYYRDPKILAGFLKGRFPSSRTDPAEIANAILEDLRGAAYYKDPKILADFLKGMTGQATS